MKEEDQQHNQPSETLEDLNTAGEGVARAAGSPSEPKEKQKVFDRESEEIEKREQQQTKELSELNKELEKAAGESAKLGAQSKRAAQQSTQPAGERAIEGTDKPTSSVTQQHPQTNTAPPKNEARLASSAPKQARASGVNLDELRKRVMEESTMHKHDARADDVKQRAVGADTPADEEPEEPLASQKAESTHRDPASVQAPPQSHTENDRNRKQEEAQFAAPAEEQKQAPQREALWQQPETSQEQEVSPMSGEPINAPDDTHADADNAATPLMEATPGEKDKFAEPKRSSTLQALRTYKSDLARTIKKQKSSLVNVIAAEEQQRITKEPVKTSEQKAKQRQMAIGYLFTALSGLFVGIGITVLIVILVTRESNPTVVPVRSIPEFFFTDEQQQVDITDKNRREILQELTRRTEEAELRLGEIANLVLTQTETFTDGGGRVSLVTASDFVEMIDARPPPSFVRSLQDAMMFGVHAFDHNQPFLIFKSTFYDNAYSGMLQWERDLNSDLAPLFGPIVYDSVRTATTTADLLRNPFQDDLIRNKDVRVLRDRQGDIVLLYGFVDPLTIVITTNENTFIEILTRITSRRF